MNSAPNGREWEMREQADFWPQPQDRNMTMTATVNVHPDDLPFYKELYGQMKKRGITNHTFIFEENQEPTYMDPPWKSTEWKESKYARELEETLKDRDLYILALEQAARDHGRREIELYQKCMELEDELRELKENKAYH